MPHRASTTTSSSSAAAGTALATAYYLAKNHGITNVAVLEKSWIGSGNAGRNTTIIRSNYLLPGNIPFYEWSMKLWEGLEQDLNYNAMVSQRGVLNLYHSDAQRDAFARRGNAMRLHGVDAELLDRDAVRAYAPFLDFDNARFPIHGGLLQRRGGTARHDAVVWGYARGGRPARRRHHPELRGHRHPRRGRPRRPASRRRAARSAPTRSALAVAGISSRVAAMAGLRLPIESHVLQAFVSEGIKPLIDQCHHLRRRTFLCQPVRQGRAGVRRRHRRLQLLCPARQPADGRGRVRRRHGGHAGRSAASASCAHGAGSWTCRWTARRSSTARRSTGLYLNAGWCYGGFKATPASGWCFAHLIARDEPHPHGAAYRLDRFATGHLIDESGMGAQPNLH